MITIVQRPDVQPAAKTDTGIETRAASKPGDVAGGALDRLRPVAAPFVAGGPSGVAVRDRLKGLSTGDERVLRLVGAHLGSLAGRDLKARCTDALDHDADRWAARKRELTAESSARWAGSITKAMHDQWALARRGKLVHIQSLEAGGRTLEHRLSLPIGQRGTRRALGGYRSKKEWFAKSRRLGPAGPPHRRARRLGRRTRAAGARWPQIAQHPGSSRDGRAHRSPMAGAMGGRYMLTARVTFPHRGVEWADRVEANRAVAYRIHLDPGRGRWYLTASRQRATVPTITLDAVRTCGVIGVDTNADHFAAWRLDRHGNPIGDPMRFEYALSGPAAHRDAQIRHAITRLLHWAESCGVAAIAIEDLDFAAEKTREKHGHRKRFRQLICGMPTGRLRARLVSMAAEAGVAIVAVDPAYTTKWARNWREPLTGKSRKVSRHDAASIAIGRRALGHAIRRRTPPPRTHQSDGHGHRSIQADHEAPGREGPRHPVTDRALDARRRTGATRTRGTSASNTVRDARSARMCGQDSLLETDEERSWTGAT
ncbi:IS200/IS605 family accessory protein TnpB-related protein [Spirillospora sp. CA-128828]|uniref:IS200/IS605 family accessory protein TnpB-related protein n=1 Tax=Spirillospora sp. CA-128828 TaxID=3240033 RepID=UPI003D8DE900